MPGEFLGRKQIKPNQPPRYMYDSGDIDIESEPFEKLALHRHKQSARHDLMGTFNYAHHKRARDMPTAKVAAS